MRIEGTIVFFPPPLIPSFYSFPPHPLLFPIKKYSQTNNQPFWWEPPPLRWLHDGVRHHPADQLRAWRSGDDRRDGRTFSVITALLGAACRRCWHCCWACWLAIPGCMALGYGMERIAYRPLRGAPRLAPLITAIGISIFCSTWRCSSGAATRWLFRRSSRWSASNVGGAIITGVQIAIILTSVLMMGGLTAAGVPHPAGIGHARHSPRTRRSRA